MGTNQNKNKDVWIGIIALIVIVGLGIWWLASNSTPAANSTTATTTAATTTAATTTAQPPQTINRQSDTVLAIAESLSGTSEFTSLLTSSGVSAQLRGPGPYTIFVPTNGAFSQLPNGTISGLTAAGKKRLVEYHVISGRAINGTAVSSGSVQALSGDALNFSFGTDNIPMVNRRAMASSTL